MGEIGESDVEVKIFKVYRLKKRSERKKKEVERKT